MEGKPNDSTNANSKKMKIESSVESGDGKMPATGTSSSTRGWLWGTTKPREVVEDEEVEAFLVEGKQPNSCPQI
jgi:hypothetical protein